MPCRKPGPRSAAAHASVGMAIVVLVLAVLIVLGMIEMRRLSTVQYAQNLPRTSAR